MHSHFKHAVMISTYVKIPSHFQTVDTANIADTSFEGMSSHLGQVCFLPGQKVLQCLQVLLELADVCLRGQLNCCIAPQTDK